MRFAPGWLTLCFVGVAVPLAAQSTSCRLINQDDSVTTESASAKPPTYLQGPVPAMPQNGRLRAVGGKVELSFVVGCDGRVDSASIVVNSASDSAFIAPALLAMAKTEFVPATSNGKKVAMRVLQRVTFAAAGYHTRDGTAVSLAQADSLLNYSVPGCPLIPYDSAQRVPPPGVTPVQYLRGSAPTYPPQLKRRMISGRVAMLFVVRCDGRVEPSSILITSFSDPAFVQPSIRAIEESVFSPATLNGIPAAQVVNQAVSYRLAGGSAPEQSTPGPWWASQCQNNVCRSPRP
ncbi:MAG: TonB family protein [Gemmatimonadota bacterium]